MGRAVQLGSHPRALVSAQCTMGVSRNFTRVHCFFSMGIYFRFRHYVRMWFTSGMIVGLGWFGSVVAERFWVWILKPIESLRVFTCYMFCLSDCLAQHIHLHSRTDFIQS